jgi:hypothetical protein
MGTARCSPLEASRKQAPTDLSGHRFLDGFLSTISLEKADEQLLSPGCPEKGGFGDGACSGYVLLTWRWQGVYKRLEAGALSPSQDDVQRGGTPCAM